MKFRYSVVADLFSNLVLQKECKRLLGWEEKVTPTPLVVKGSSRALDP
jgi:hypothetical protein